MSLQGRKILVGLTGGIACYKVPYLIRALRKAEADVHIIMTSSATKFITPLTLESVSNHPVAISMFPEGEYVATRHIDLATWPELVVIAPATANFLGKAASGISDDLLTTTICATPRPVMVAPAMNPQMWAHPATERNVAFLKEIGYQFVGPAEGEMACDHIGRGRMVEPEELLAAIEQHFGTSAKKKALAGKKILVTAGPCREPIDPVRFISNRSSGKMGFAIAQAAAALGAKTTLISGPTSLRPPSNVEFVQIETTADLMAATARRFRTADCLIMAAAPADYKPKVVVAQKIKKGAGVPELLFEATTDILKKLGSRKRPDQLLVGFALETENGLVNARKKLKEKNLDLILLNSPSADGSGFDFDTNQVTLLAPNRKPEHWPLQPKRDIAYKLLEKLSAML